MTDSLIEQAQINQASLNSELDRVYLRLLPGTPSTNSEISLVPALDRLCQIFGLGGFERDLLLCCTGAELESRFAEACATLHQDARLIWPTFGLAFKFLEHPHWSVTSPAQPLRYWGLIHVNTESGLTRSPLRLDERILHYLLESPCTPESLQWLMPTLLYDDYPLSAELTACANEAAEYWQNTTERSLRPVLLIGRKTAAQQAIAMSISRSLNCNCFVLRAEDIPVQAEERNRMVHQWNREWLLTGAMLYIRTAGLAETDSGRLRGFLDAAWGPMAIEVQEGHFLEQLHGFRIQLPLLATAARKEQWLNSLGDSAKRLNGSLERIAEYFTLDADDIRFAGEMTRETLNRHPDTNADQLAWQVCCQHTSRAFQGLARRIEPKAGWGDLVLPELQITTLKQIAAQIRQRPKVHGAWGFADRYSCGLGVSVLFAGASGTGKTMAAEVLAAELNLELYQIDLSNVVNKYIGETEKNLRRIFDAAEDSGAVLLFDEADALFGKRSEVRDSHDRHANLEVSYLLQRMEAYRGLAVLTTNMKHALDSAFLRRIRFIVQFPLPNECERQRIWRQVFPDTTPLHNLDFERIAKLNVTGGMIRNIATHSAFLAADQETAVDMAHILSAAQIEYAKVDRPLTPAETGNWL